MSKDSDWIINSQREAAKKIEDEKTKSASVLEQKARQELEAAEEERKKRSIAEQILKEYLPTVNKYLAELKNHGYIVTQTQNATHFSMYDGSKAIREPFSDDELSDLAESKGKKLPIARNAFIEKNSRTIRPFIKMNEREIEIGGDRTSTAWEAPAIEISIGKSKNGPEIKSKAQVSTFIDSVFEIDQIIEDKGSGRSRTDGRIITKTVSETEPAPCIVVENYIEEPNENFSNSTVKKYTELSEIVAYTPEEFDALFKDFLIAVVAKLEELHIRQQEEKKVDRKKRWGF